MKDKIEKKELLEDLVVDLLDERRKLDKDIEICNHHLEAIRHLISKEDCKRVIKLGYVDRNKFKYRKELEDGTIIKTYSYSFFLDECLDLSGCNLIIED